MPGSRQSSNVPRSAAATAVALLAVAVVGVAYWQLRIVDPVRPPGKINRLNRDLYSAYLPVHEYAYRSAELVPLWNPHQLAGTPFLANANGVLYPPNFLAAVLPVERTLGVLGALHLALAGVATFLCARALATTRLAAVLAASAFMLSPHVTSALVHPSHLAGYAWLPVIALAVGALVVHPGLRPALLLGVAGAVLLSTGSSQMVVYAAYTAALGGLVFLVAHRSFDRTRARRVACFAPLALMVMCALAAVQILPTIELLPHATRQSVGLEYLQASEPSFALVGVTLLATGGACALVPLAALDAARRRFVWAMAAVLAFTLLVGLGTRVFLDVFVALPLADRFRAPQRMLVIADLMIALLAAIGFDRLRRSAGERRSLVLAAVGAGVVVATSPLWWSRLGPSAYRQGAAIAVAVLVVTLAVSRRQRWRAGLAAAVVGLLLAGRFAAPPNWLVMPQHQPPEFFAAPPFAQFLRANAGADRIVIVRDQQSFFPLMAKAGTLYGLHVVEDYEPLAPRAYGELRTAFQVPSVTRPDEWRVLSPDERERRWRYFDLLSVRYVVVQRGLSFPPAGWDRFRLAYRDREVDVFESTTGLPRAYLVGAADVATNVRDVAQHLRDPGFDVHRSVVLDAEPVWPDAPQADVVPAATARVVEVAANEVRVDVATPGSAVLVLTDLHWPGWRATVDGEPRDIRRANHLFRAVAVPPGVHEVRFRYDPTPARIGAWVTVAALIGVAGCLLIVRAERRPPE